ncbi:hypothetical protein [Mesomycoplasma ovipneumoniae]|uniref:hypothetical protein n=1 Tax=Mesomycoplasma ovipneumoniae TaxID=29562 RepID=UPI00083E7135|nr:hypothetical protein [Mesomycoplasma ovipneumoniae]
MPSVDELEIKNLPKEFKENLYNLLKDDPDIIKSELELSQDWEKTGNLKKIKALDMHDGHIRYILELGQDWEKTGNLEALDKALEHYFSLHHNLYWTLIRRYKNSLYNQCGRKWWLYRKPRLLSRYIKFKSSPTYIKFKKLSSSRGWETFWKVFHIITFPIQLPFFIIAMFLRYIVAPIIAGLLWWLGKWILIFLVAGGIMAGIAHLLMYIFS